MGEKKNEWRMKRKKRRGLKTRERKMARNISNDPVVEGGGEGGCRVRPSLKYT